MSILSWNGMTFCNFLMGYSLFFPFFLNFDMNQLKGLVDQGGDKRERDASQSAAADGAPCVHGSEPGLVLYDHSSLRLCLLSSLLGEKSR